MKLGETFLALRRKLEKQTVEFEDRKHRPDPNIFLDASSILNSVAPLFFNIVLPPRLHTAALLCEASSVSECETHNLPSGGSSYLKEAHLCFPKCIFRSTSHTVQLT